MPCEELLRKLRANDVDLAIWVERALFMIMAFESAGKREFENAHCLAQEGLRAWNERHGKPCISDSNALLRAIVVPLPNS